jgi:hypothetical protein
VVFVAVIALLAFCFLPSCLAFNSGEASAALHKAEADLGSAYTAVADAERAGANVTVFVSRLKAADGYLADGFTDYRGGDYDGAVSKAEACSSAVDGIVGEAVNLQASAERNRGDMLVMTSIISVVALIVFSFLAVFGWQLLKSHYSKKLLGYRPIVEE